MTRPYALVILTWNQWPLTQECLRSLKELPAERWTVWVIDNGSREKMPPGFEKGHPSLRVVPLPQNLGFAGGCNRGIGAALQEEAQVVVLLNNDARVSPEDLERLATAVSQGPYSILGAVNYRSSRPQEVFSTGQIFRWPFCRLQRLTDVSASEAPVPIFGIVGSCFAVRAALFERIGFFDERFFIYYEEADLCLRARAAGLGVAYHPKVKVFHDISAVFGEQNPALLYLYTRNLGLFIQKHCPKSLLPFCMISYLVRALLKSIYFLIKARCREGKAVVAGVLDWSQGRFGKGRLDRFLKG